MIAVAALRHGGRTFALARIAGQGILAGAALTAVVAIWLSVELPSLPLVGGGSVPSSDTPFVAQIAANVPLPAQARTSVPLRVRIPAARKPSVRTPAPTAEREQSSVPSAAATAAPARKEKVSVVKHAQPVTHPAFVTQRAPAAPQPAVTPQAAPAAQPSATPVTAQASAPAAPVADTSDSETSDSGSTQDPPPTGSGPTLPVDPPPLPQLPVETPPLQQVPALPSAPPLPSVSLPSGAQESPPAPDAPAQSTTLPSLP